MDEMEIWRIAADLVARHGAEGAVFQAASHADAYRSAGDPANAQIWLLVLDAIEEFVRPLGTCELTN